MYQITMTYAYWRAGRHKEKAVFDLFFRKNPFKGQFTVFAGLGEVLSLLSSFSFTESDIAYLKSLMPHCEDAFFEWMRRLDCKGIKVFAMEEGSLCFPRIPLLRVEGPLAVAQLLETPLLNLINFPSLVATYAARLRWAVGPDKTLLEFGLRRAQGPDGGLSASKYSYIGGFNGTSNVLAGKLIGIGVKGTHAHAFVQSYSSFNQIKISTLDGVDFVAKVKHYREELGYLHTNTSELAAFTAYALAFPDGFLALLDTYDTLQSGVPNYLCVALALDDLGHRAVGCRLDSGDLAYLSQEVRREVNKVAEEKRRPVLLQTNIVASNDLNEETLHSLNDLGHSIDTFGVGTNLVTCQAQPALGCVYKLVSIEGTARIKLSQNKSKITIPSRKWAYRLMGKDGVPLLDLLLQDGEAAPEPGKPVLCRHPFEATKRARVTPSTVVPLHSLVWDGEAGGATKPTETIDVVRERVSKGMQEIREDTLQRLQPTPYKVSLSESLYEFLHELWEKEAPVRELC
ncbi:unnamed protein product [Discosporangium mesarthrocarpum]